MPNPFRDGLFAAIFAGAKSAFGGIVSLWAGIAWGGIIASTTPLTKLSAAHWVGGTALLELLSVLLGRFAKKRSHKFGRCDILSRPN